MEYNKAIRNMEIGDEVEGFYILKGAYPKVTANGKPFLNATLSDASGSMEAKVWDYPGPINAADEGKVVKIQGTVTEFRGASQATIESIRLTDQTDHYDVAALVPVAPIDADLALSNVLELLNSIQDEDYKCIALELFRRHKETFQQIPAAKSVHHGFLNGLLMHTGNMMKMADFLAGLYSDSSELGLVTGYSMKGQLLGHLVMGAQEVGQVARELNLPEEKSVLLQHLVLSHHGEPEYGAAVRPICAESELLSYIDQIDSRMEIYREAFDKLEEGEFSNRIFALEKRVYKHSIG